MRPDHHVTDTDQQHRCIHCGTLHDNLLHGHNVSCVHCRHLTATDLELCDCPTCEAMAAAAARFAGPVAVSKPLADVLGFLGWLEEPADERKRIYANAGTDDRVWVYHDRIVLRRMVRLEATVGHPIGEGDALPLPFVRTFQSIRFRDERQAIDWLSGLIA